MSEPRPIRSATDAPLAGGHSNANPPDIGFIDLLREDFRTHGGHVLSPGFWAVAVHRFGNWRMSVQAPLLRFPLSASYRAAYRATIALWGIDIPYNVKVGRRLRLGHHGCMVIGASGIGDDVTVQHSVTIGLLRRNAGAFPTIGNRVEIGPGACIVGGIEVGDDCFIGANTVVSQNLPPRSTIFGMPARLVEPDDLLTARSSAARRGPAGV